MNYLHTAPVIALRNYDTRSTRAFGASGVMLEQCSSGSHLGTDHAAVDVGHTLVHKLLTGIPAHWEYADRSRYQIGQSSHVANLDSRSSHKKCLNSGKACS